MDYLPHKQTEKRGDVDVERDGLAGLHATPLRVPVGQPGQLVGAAEDGRERAREDVQAPVAAALRVHVREV